MKLLLALLLLVGEEAAVAERVVDVGTNDNRVMAHLDHLSNTIGPRLTGSAALQEANEWALAKFLEWGLDANLVPYGEMPVGFERGPSSGAVVGEEDRPFTFITNAWSAGTDGPVTGKASLEPIPGTWVVSDERDVRIAAEGAGCLGTVRPGTEDGRLVMGGDMDITVEELPDKVRVILEHSEFEALKSRLAAGEELELVFDIDNRFVPGPITQHNVVADLVGHELPGEYVIVGGHIDTWDGATGTTDNGTGVSTTMEAARLLSTAGARPRRTIRFMLWGGEEQGLRGSRAYVLENQDLMDDISAVLVHDGGTNRISGISVTRAMRAQIEEAFAPVQAYAPEFEIGEVVGISGGGSDHTPFIQNGVPGFFWWQSGDADYTHTHHTQWDTFDAAIPEYQRDSSVIVALAALGIADLPEKLDRKHLTAPRRMLGVYLGGDGVTINGVVSPSQASALGLEQGDVIVSINGEPIGETRLRTLLNAGEPRKLVAWRRGEETMSALFQWDVGHIERAAEKVVLTTADGVEIHGDTYMGKSDGAANGSAVVLLHMNKSDRGSWLPVRDELYEAGIATLAIDLRGHGESGGDAKDTNEMEMDAKAAVAWLESRGYEAENIGLMGASIGCSVALRTAVNDPRLAGAALMTPGTDYLGVDSMADIVRWDGRRLVMFTSEDEAGRGAQPLMDALPGPEAWAHASLVMRPETDIHGTKMFGRVDGIEPRIADWWVATFEME